jgi:hypothetical protein
MALALAKDMNEEDTRNGDYESPRYAFDDLVDNCKENGKQYALESILQDNFGSNYSGNIRKGEIIRALTINGWWAGDWEEGSAYIALEGKVKAADKALRKIEAGHHMDDLEF